nr:Crp/Fnr family transcriptional regulator [Pedobacter panaciterrae]
MKTLLEILNSIYPLSPELSEQISSKSEFLDVKKKTVLLEAGQTSKTIYFILRGAVRIYYLNKDGVENTTWLLLENEFVISVYSFFRGGASFEYIETTEDCELIALHKEQLDYLYNHFMEFNFIGRKLTEAYYIRNEEQANNLRVLGGKARYLELLQTNPKILQRFSLGYIASYLGIAQETLSRIRKQK